MPCAYCKANHDSDSCPWYARARSYFKSKDLKESYQGGSPAPFIGRFGYPDVNIGILTPPGVNDSENYDAPRSWAEKGTSISAIAELRGSLVNSHIKGNIRQLQGKLLETAQLTAMTTKPVNVAIELEKKPTYMVHFDQHASPTGPTGVLKNIVQESNPHVHTMIEKAVSDTDLKAGAALTLLFKKGIEENKLTQLLSTGTLGLGKNRKLVPTRWSITATDDTLGKALHDHILTFSHLSQYELYTANYHGNYYYILLYPGSWQYELVEHSLPTNGTSKDSEGFEGRHSYAENCVGGYYTVRLAILEHLTKMKRQAGAFVIRIITSEYTVPLGVWVTREASRKAFASTPVSFSSKEELERAVLDQIKLNHSFFAETFFKESVIHTKKENQKSLWSF